MDTSSTGIAAGITIPGMDAISARSGGEDDLTVAAEVIAEAESVLVDTMFDEIVRKLRLELFLGSVSHPDRGLPVVITDRARRGCRPAPIRTVRTSVRAPPAANRS